MGAPPSFGAALVGFAAACFLCGCMLIQVYIYIQSGSTRNDSFRFKGLVSHHSQPHSTDLMFCRLALSGTRSPFFMYSVAETGC